MTANKTYTWPIMANCNYESSDTDRDIYDIMRRAEMGDCSEELRDALDELESTLEEHADSGSVLSVEVCRRAERTVRDVAAGDAAR